MGTSIKRENIKGFSLYGYPFSLYKEEKSSGIETHTCLWGRRKYEQGKKEWMRSRQDLAKNQTTRREKHQNFCLSIPYKGGVSSSRLAKGKWWIVIPERRDHLPIIWSIFNSYWDIILMFSNMILLLSWDCQWSAIQAIEDILLWGWPRTMTLFTQITGKFTGLSDFIPPRLPPSRNAPQSIFLEVAKASTYHNATVWYTRLPRVYHTVAWPRSSWCSSLPFTREHSEAAA